MEMGRNPLCVDLFKGGDDVILIVMPCLPFLSANEALAEPRCLQTQPFEQGWLQHFASNQPKWMHLDSIREYNFHRPAHTFKLNCIVCSIACLCPRPPGTHGYWHWYERPP